MSSAPKRSHEDGCNSSSKHVHEDLLPYPRLMPAVSNEYHVPHESGVENRIAKIPRMEQRDPDRRSPLHPVFRAPSSSLLDYSNLDQSLPSESRVESKDSKEGRDTRFEHGDSHNDTKVETRVEKDGYAADSSHLNWKESKDQHSGKRFSGPPTVGSDPWTAPYNSPHSQFETAKDGSTSKERRCADACEAVGENKVETKVDDRFKEKDRRRKDAKYRDWGERDRKN